MKTLSFCRILLLATLLCLGLVSTGQAQVPQLLNYQGRIAVNGTNFTGTGQFKFALVDGGTNVAHTATGTATISGGFLTIVTVTDGGAGYTSAPSVTATGGGGSGAVLTAQGFGPDTFSAPVLARAEEDTAAPTH